MATLTNKQKDIIFDLNLVYESSDCMTIDRPEFSKTAIELYRSYLIRRFYDLPIGIVWSKDDPYTSFQEMKLDATQFGRIRVYTGGSPAIIDHQSNLMFRAIHDWAHIQSHSDFSMLGELNAYREMVRSANNYFNGKCPNYIKKILFSEVVLQSAAAFQQGLGVEQRIVILPVECIEAFCTAIDKHFA
jgi:hypothetical protein